MSSPRAGTSALRKKSRPAFMALPHAARLLRLSFAGTIQLIHRGVLRARLVSGRWWIESASIEALQARTATRKAG